MPVFLDSNIVLYALGDDEAKRSVAAGLLAA
jgi:predicted nucleic acid-binding protein